MTKHRRYLDNHVREDLTKKMVFVAGPRQVGKTTLGKSILKTGSYLNWDIPEARERILKCELPVKTGWFFDEIHKYRDWRAFMKGIADEFGGKFPILVAGSARLDYYRFGGDSLQGRYFYYRLYPLSVRELDIGTQKDFATLSKLGGFPEPFFSQSLRDSKRWSREYRNRLLEEDIRSLENVADFAKLEQLLLALPSLVGSPLSYNSLRENLQVAHKTATRWVDILERVMNLFRLLPLTHKNKLRAVHKERKHYHFDWTLVTDRGPRFENLVAVHLLKWVHFQQDTEGADYDLKYFRDIDGREVDFVITQNGEPESFIECKYQDGPISKSLVYLKKKYPTASFHQITMSGTKDYISGEGIRVQPALKFLRELV